MAYLAQMFRRGEGTQADWPLSCAPFTNVWGYTRERGPAAIGSIPFVEAGIEEVCLTDPQSQPEVMALRRACFLDGVTRQTFLLDGVTWIVVDRRGFHIDLGGDHDDANLETLCHNVMVSLTDNFALEVRNRGTHRTVSWSGSAADTSLNSLVRTVLKMLNPNPGDGCASEPPKVR
jgi:hypothetical protein